MNPSDILEQQTIPTDWFCIIATLVAHTRDTAQSLADNISKMTMCGNETYLFDGEGIPVKASSPSEWKSVIQEMCHEGILMIATEEAILNHSYRLFTSIAGLRMMSRYCVGEVMLTDSGYNVWCRFRDAWEPFSHPIGLQLWDESGCRVIFVTSMDLALRSCPLFSEDCRMRQVPTGNNEPACIASHEPCTIEEYGPFWIDAYGICGKGFKVRCPLVKKRPDEELGY